MLSVEILQFAHAKDLSLPRYMSEGASGLDLCSAIPTFSLKTMERKLVATGLAIALPKGYEAQVRPRSGLALKKGITCLNTPGTIDSDYRGEIAVILINLGEEEVLIERAERIAQLVIQKVEQVELKLVETLDATLRGQAGFGSTGK